MLRKYRFRLWMPFTLLCLSGCAGVSSDVECNETTTDRCMTLEQTREKQEAVMQAALETAVRYPTTTNVQHFLTLQQAMRAQATTVSNRLPSPGNEGGHHAP